MEISPADSCDRNLVLENLVLEPALSRADDRYVPARRRPEAVTACASQYRDGEW